MRVLPRGRVRDPQARLRRRRPVRRSLRVRRRRGRPLVPAGTSGLAAPVRAAAWWSSTDRPQPGVASRPQSRPSRCATGSSSPGATSPCPSQSCTGQRGRGSCSSKAVRTRSSAPGGKRRATALRLRSTASRSPWRTLWRLHQRRRTGRLVRSAVTVVDAGLLAEIPRRAHRATSSGCTSRSPSVATPHGGVLPRGRWSSDGFDAEGGRHGDDERLRGQPITRAETSARDCGRRNGDRSTSLTCERSSPPSPPHALHAAEVEVLATERPERGAGEVPDRNRASNHTT